MEKACAIDVHKGCMEQINLLEKQQATSLTI